MTSDDSMAGVAVAMLTAVYNGESINDAWEDDAYTGREAGRLVVALVLVSTVILKEHTDDPEAVLQAVALRVANLSQPT